MKKNFKIVKITCILFVIYFFFKVFNMSNGEIRRLYLYDDIASYPSSGWMGTQKYIKLNLCNIEPIYKGTYCVHFSRSGKSESNDDWSGVSFQAKDQIFNTPGTDLSGASSVNFACRGLIGGEHIIIKSMDNKYVKEIILSNKWQEFKISFNGNENFTSINNLFTIIIDKNQEASVYLDEIYLEFKRTQTSKSAAISTPFVKGVVYNNIDSSWYDKDFKLIRKDLHANSIRLEGQTDANPVLIEKALKNNLSIRDHGK